jgi:hypothetical protein
MTQFIKRKSKAVIKFKLDDLDKDETTIKLNSINPALLDKKYNMKEVKNIMEKDLVEFSQNADTNKKKKVYKKSDIDKLQTDLENLGISDNKSKNYDTIVSNNMKIKAYSCFKEEFSKCEVPSTTSIFCWWCRHSVPKEFHPLGLPIRYTKDYFDTEGIFCSFNCMCSYLHDNLNNNLYKDSSSLIYLMYKSIFGEFPIKMNLKKAPSWKLLKQYGGPLSIEEFRDMFNTVNNLTQNIEFNNSSPTGKLPIKPVKLTYLE